MELPFTEQFQLGQEAITTGVLRDLQRWLSLSDTRLAAHLGTNTASLRKWLNEPDAIDRMHSTTIARVGKWSYDTGMLCRELLDKGVDVNTLCPLSIVAGQMGRSTESLLYTRMCRTGEISCHDLGALGVYIRRSDVDRLREGARQ